MALPTGLLDSVKNYLDITWADENTDLKIAGIIERGIKYINGIAGSEKDYLVEDKAKELLLEYCRYVRSNALEAFQINFKQELLTFQINEEVARYEIENPDPIV